jgi:Reverse transcriptase (RNA-dependent DNA polymerase)
MLTETWLRDGVFNREFIDDRYEVLRCDRTLETSTRSDGGGVLIAVKKSKNYTIIERDEWKCRSIEDLWITIKPCSPSNQQFHVCCVYLPGDTKSDKFELFTTNAAKHVNDNPDDVFIICGDFNVPSFEPSQPQSMTQSAKAVFLRDMMQFCNVEQLSEVRARTTSENLLDLVFSNRFARVETCKDPLLPVDAFHPPLTFHLKTSMSKVTEATVRFRNFKKVSWTALNSDLMNVNWPLKFIECTTIDDKVETFYQVISEALDIHCPVITLKARRHPCWFSKDTKHLLGKKRAYHTKWKLHRNQRDYATFGEFRRKTKDAIAKDFAAYNKAAEERIKSDPKEFWKFVNAKKENGAGVADYLRLGDEVAFNRKDAVELFAKQFESVYETEETFVGEQVRRESSEISWQEMTISMSVVFEKLKELDIKKAPGPDQLPPLLFCRCASALTFPLFEIFNQSLKSGIFPTEWKTAHVTPIHKDGSAHDARNYRPISKLSIPAKVLDNIVADELFERFKNVIIPQQHGFFKKRSTITNLLDYTEQLQQRMDRGGQTDVIFTDFSKAFDKVSHAKLVDKLENNGIDGVMREWFLSYITGRKQKVQLGNFTSRSIDVTSSVVQGSHLGPLLFSLFINDINEIIHDANFCVYADDLKIYREINSQDDARILQGNLDRLNHYVLQNKLSLNVKKCVAVSFTRRTTNHVVHPYQIGGETLERRDSMRDLGVQYDSQLTFNDHVDKVCGTARRMMGFVMRTGKFFDNPYTFTTLYNALVRSNVEYASVIWNPFTACQKLQVERVQHRFLKYVSAKCLGRRPNEEVNYAAIEAQLKLDKLELRRTTADVKFVVKSFHGEVDGQTFLQNFHLAETTSTRSNDIFRIQTSRTDVGKYSVVNRLMTTFNSSCDSNIWLRHQPDDNHIRMHIRN